MRKTSGVHPRDDRQIRAAHYDANGNRIPEEQFFKREPAKPATVSLTVREFGDYMVRLMEWMRESEAA